MTAKQGIVHLWDLSEDKVFVKLSNNTQKILIEKALKLFRNEDELAKQLNSNQATVNDFKNSRGKSTSLKFIKNLSLFLCERGLTEFSLENLEKQIELIKTKVGFGIKNPKFPMNFNCKEGAQIISAIFFDGGIREDLRPFYVNNERILIDRIVNSLANVVGDIYYSKDKDRGTFFIDFSPILGIILVNGLNISTGKKIRNNPSIPEFILNGNLEVQKVFLQQAFDDEGSISNGVGRRVRLTQYNSEKEPPTRLLQIKELLEKFNIRISGPYYSNTWIAKDGKITYGFQLQISNQKDLRNFAETISFGLEEKRNKLKKVLISYNSEPIFKKGSVFEEVLKVCKELKDENQKITNKNITKRLKRVESYARQLTLRMVKEGKLKVSKERINLGGRKGATRREFDLIES